VKTSLQSWLRNRWLVQHKSNTQEITNLFAISDRDLHACNTKTLPADWRFAIAYNAALQAATAALAAAGYRASRETHHHRVIQSLEFTLAPERKMIDTFDTFRKKRNISSYDLAGSVSDKEAKEMYELAAALRARVERWIRKKHPKLLAHTTHP
jgi:predicted DNA-binding ribbon-helix-helix protein